MKLIQKLGPGLLYAGAAIGVSHIVLSTKAGAKYGISLLLIVILANILKYPFFEFSIRYASVKKKSLLHGYQEMGKWATILFLVTTVSTMFSVQAAVTIVTAGLFEEVFQIALPPYHWSLIILLICVLILVIGKYKLLDNTIKWIIILLAVTLVITLIAAFLNPENTLQSGSFSFTNHADILFFIALVGWMPAPFDISVWNSVWAVEKQKEMKLSLKESLFDFKIGYWGTTLLACFFLLLGALMMFNSGEKLSDNGGIYAKQVIHIFTANLGSWSYYIVAIAALTTMFSTTLTCFDAAPRTLSKVTFGKELSSKKQNTIYWSLLALIGFGTLIIIAFFTKNMGEMVKTATAISFVSAPVIAIINYLVIYNKNFPKENRPKIYIKYLSWIGILFLVSFSIYYLYIILAS